jgi:hypothetical protein
LGKPALEISERTAFVDLHLRTPQIVGWQEVNPALLHVDVPVQAAR